MEMLPCGHIAVAGPRRVCRHLTESEAEVPYVRLFSGRGVEYDLCCPPCGESGPELVVACEGCVARVDEDEWECEGFRGKPEVKERPEPIPGALRRVRLPFAPLDAAPIPSLPHRWLLLDKGAVVRWRSDQNEAVGRVRLKMPARAGEGYFKDQPARPRLHASPSGRYCAVVTDFGRYGTVVDLTSGRRTATLDRDGHYPGTTYFPFAFVSHVAGERFIHATGWNRLDVSDAATGRLLTDRAFLVPEGSRLPDHHLEYFHGALAVSPDGRWVADDGWVWHPVAMPSVWDLSAWWQNPYETEDGPSIRRLAHRSDWNMSMCWLGGKLAVGGLGGLEDSPLLPGVRIFHPETGAEENAFAGPEGALFAAGGKLVSAAPGGAEFWDAGTGERLGRIPAFVPIRHHPASGELLQLAGDTAILHEP
ncbi:hypothetical protein K1W54_31445 [Micromonospora sp. CPCC 205371]|nr:hypothetical protein [Micromonospora sp. CPCC 205371]